MSASKHIVCPSCGSINRVPNDRMHSAPSCGKCKKALFQGKPVALTSADFHRHISRSDIPVVVDFWAGWCGPCKMMAPAFAQAASRLEPQVRLAKVDTEANQMIAGKYGIRSIPTLIMFQNGAEKARMSGAMNVDGLVNWIRGQLD